MSEGHKGSQWSFAPKKVFWIHKEGEMIRVQAILEQTDPDAKSGFLK